MISVSGVVLWFSPKGRIAHWTNWMLWGFDKEEWAALHTVFVTVFLIASVFHLLVFNWTAFWGYLKRREQQFRYKWEMVGTTVLFVFLLIGVVTNLSPVMGVYNLGEHLRERYEVAENEPPIPHAELLTVAQFAEAVLDTPTAVLMTRLAHRGFAAQDSNETFESLADRFNVAPSAIFAAVQTEGAGRTAITAAGGMEGYPTGSGLGRKSLVQAVRGSGVEPDSALARLSRAGITDAGRDETLRDIGSRHDLHAPDIVRIISGR